MFWIISILIIIAVVIALFIFPELGKAALNLGARLLQWDGILLIIVVIFVIFFMYAKHKQLENRQLELHASLKQEGQIAARTQKQQKPLEDPSREIQKKETLVQQPESTPAPVSRIQEIENVEKMIKQWLKHWEEGHFSIYKTFYSTDFQSKGKNLDAWISHKTNVRSRSKNIKISIENLKITLDGNQAKAVFIQNYSSSVMNDSGTKTLEIRKENDGWKIYREIM
jgi:murein L,D-transpeptidase YafK